MTSRLMAALAVLAFTFSPALADTFNINLSSGETDTLLVTVTDMNYPTPKVVYDNNLTSGQLVPVDINGDNGNNGHITWRASTSDRTKCGSGDVSGLSSGNNVTINTPSSC